MKKSKHIVISEYRNWLLFYSIIFVCGIIGTVVDILSLFWDEFDIGFPGPSFVAVLLIPIIAYFHTRNKGRVEITKDYIYVWYPNRLTPAPIDLNKQVYFGKYESYDRQLYIVVSNEPFKNDFRKSGYKDIDYNSQIMIHATWKVLKYLPKDTWIEMPEE